MSTTAVRPKKKRSAPGRPTREAAAELKSQVLAAAQREFLANGFEGVSIEGIAQTAGTSKLTLYRHFTGKKGLFAAVVEKLVARYATRLSSLIDPAAAPQDVLYRMGLCLADSYFTPEGRSLTRIMIGEVQRLDDLSYMSNRMAELARGPVEAYLAQLQARGLARFEDRRRAAVQFVNLCMLGQYYLLCDNAKPLPSATTRRRIVRSAVKLFSAGYLAR